jgi:uncharacterized membrane protein YgaE (UPF0421/DUF939 family)
MSAMHVIRTTLAAAASLAIAHALALPEPYWATISTIVAVQSSLVASWNLSWRRFAGTALGAAMSAALALLFAPSGWLFSLAMFAAGVVCLLIRLDRAAYRFASITLAIVILASHGQRAWITAGHRFIEVAIGIAIGLVATAVWPERSDSSSPHASSP